MIDQSEIESIVVYETEGNWAGLLRRQLANDSIVVDGVETLAALERRLTDDTSGCFAVQMTEKSAHDGLRWFYDASRQFPSACFVGIVNPELPKWSYYEAGALLVIDHPLEIGVAARFIHRFLARRAVSNRPTRHDRAEEVLESIRLSLPWSRHDTEARSDA